MSEPADTLAKQVREYTAAERRRPFRAFRSPPPPTPQILRSLSDQDLDALCDAVHEEGCRRGFGNWWAR